MATTQPIHRTELAPQEMLGRSRVWALVMGLAAIGLVLGIVSYARELTGGMAVTGMRDVGIGGGATWGLYVAFLIYMMGVSFAGITIAAMIRLLKLEQLRPVGRIAEILSVVAVVLGGLAIIVDLGQPLRGLVNLFRYARPQSPFFGTFTLVLAGYGFASLVYLYLGSRRDAAVLAERPGRLQWLHRFVASGYGDTPEERERHDRASFWLAVGIVPLLVVASSTLGFVFGLQIGRPGWFSALQAPAFVTLAGVSGVGLVIVLAALVRHAEHRSDVLTPAVFAWLGKLMLGLLSVYIYFMAVELVTATYAGSEADADITAALLTGTYAPIFWTSVAFLVVPLGLLVYAALAKRWSIGMLTAVSVLVNLGALGKRYLIVVPSQTHGTLLPYGEGSYTPALVEYGVVLGLVALGVLMIGAFMKALPVIELQREEEVGQDA